MASPGPLKWLLRWAAPAATLAFAWIALHHYEVDNADLAALTAYLLFGVGLPGMLIWRSLRGRTDVFYLDAGAGFAVGCALQLLVYLPGRWAGFPQVVTVAPIVILVAFAIDPRLRRWWHGSPSGGVGGAWLIAVSIMLGILMLAIGTYRTEPLAGFGSDYPYVDMPFHIALAAELKHHVPFTTPYVHGVPLQYHWYSHAHIAATSWATGVEIEVLVRRIIPVTMLVAATLGIAGLAQSWARRRWTGPVAAAVLVCTSGVTLVGWQRGSSAPLLGQAWWASPSQSFGQMMVIPAVALLVGIVRHRRLPRPTVWILFTLSVAGVMAAKATMIPLLAAACCMACASWLVFRRRFHLPSLISLGIVIGAFLFAQFVIFGGATQGTTIKPFVQVNAQRLPYGFSAVGGNAWGPVSTFTLSLLDLSGYLLLAAALFAFGRRLVTHPGVAALSGIAIGGMGATLVLVQLGGSERYFTRAAIALMIPMAVWGLALLVRRTDWKIGLLLVVAAALGGPIALAISRANTTRPVAGNNWQALWYAAGPLLVGLAAAAVVGLLLSLVAKKSGTRLSAAAAAFVLVIGMGTLPTYRMLARFWQAVDVNGLDHVSLAAGPSYLPPDGREAARLLRSHSAPDDLVATNAHCRIPGRALCDSRAFWLAGWSERRVLLEGWGYTVRSNAADSEEAKAGRYWAAPFWDAQLKAENDAVFTDPSPATADVLKQKYGVGFLFVDKRFGAVDEKRMKLIATSLYERADVQVWQLR
ncbi:hypothetical protein F1D05_23195 [Kribbella qitaiheensis]|uniref:Uncharacterized protein n=1 Tax=Kribbella qitaiheensis TaxID=1544730 RepID=A0A7G6X221_9ACTN|nr:hypothetical protein [Kribbella qitaiheensis]QNE20286.1 hypothetical protein F1D05_23195 [Kribbella qitaiheensis]